MLASQVGQWWCCTDSSDILKFLQPGSRRREPARVSRFEDSVSTVTVCTVFRRVDNHNVPPTPTYTTHASTHAHTHTYTRKVSEQFTSVRVTTTSAAHPAAPPGRVKTAPWAWRSRRAAWRRRWRRVPSAPSAPWSASPPSSSGSRSGPSAPSPGSPSSSASPWPWRGSCARPRCCGRASPCTPRCPWAPAGAWTPLCSFGEGSPAPWTWWPWTTRRACAGCSAGRKALPLLRRRRNVPCRPPPRRPAPSCNPCLRQRRRRRRRRRWRRRRRRWPW